MNWTKIIHSITDYALNKYVVTLLIAAVIFVFVGDQSMLRDIHRYRQIRQARKELKQTQATIEQQRYAIQSLQSTDSLERYAREQYFMHAPNEDIYWVEE